MTLRAVIASGALLLAAGLLGALVGVQVTAGIAPADVEPQRGPTVIRGLPLDPKEGAKP